MQPTLRSLIFFLLFAFLLSRTLSAQQSSMDSSSCPCTLRGSIIDSVSGQPIHGALVSATGGSVPPTFTDSEGKFQFDGLPSGTMDIQAAKPGYSSNQRISGGLPATFVVELGADTPPAKLKLTPEGVIFGKVTDENGEPLEGFTVGLLYRSTFGGHLFQDRRSQSVTDDEGNFRIADLPRGSCYLIVRETQVPATSLKNSRVPQGYPPVYYPSASDLSSAILIKVLPGKPVQANFSLKREPSVRISGTVTGYNQQAQVLLRLQSSTGEPLPAEISFDPLTGAFHSKWFPPGSYTLSAQGVPSEPLDAYLHQSMAIHPLTLTSELSDIHLALQPAVDIPIEIRGEPTAPPPFQVLLVPRDMLSFHSAHFSTWIHRDRNFPGEGSLTVQGVPPGSYGFQFISGGPYYLESATWGATNILNDDLVVSSSGSVPPIELTVREGVVSISGTVVSDDQPIFATVLIFSSDQRQMPKFIPTDFRGTFAMPSLAPGTYRVIAVDDLQAFDYENPEALARVSSYIQEITLTAKQSASLRLDLAKVGE